ncbi:hypothetical protein P4647_23430 [Peribacillus frigoritolerans]|uniref:hypothetical protein n=1 Tax=Peribacillus frigoritolerans TaxID=450367 RepID=UPI002E1D6D80|nr:hypothetical protein [Peribacillus frigoritolerans]
MANFKKVVEVLRQKGMSDNDIYEFIEEVKNTEEIVYAVEEYFVHGIKPQIKIEGYNHHELMTQYNLSETGAFIMLDFLKHEPEFAKQVLFKHDSLY